MINTTPLRKPMMEGLTPSPRVNAAIIIGRKSYTLAAEPSFPSLPAGSKLQIEVLDPAGPTARVYTITLNVTDVDDILDAINTDVSGGPQFNTLAEAKVVGRSIAIEHLTPGAHVYIHIQKPALGGAADAAHYLGFPVEDDPFALVTGGSLGFVTPHRPGLTTLVNPAGTTFLDEGEDWSAERFNRAMFGVSRELDRHDSRARRPVPSPTAYDIDISMGADTWGAGPWAIERVGGPGSGTDIEALQLPTSVFHYVHTTFGTPTTEEETYELSKIWSVVDLNDNEIVVNGLRVSVVAVTRGLGTPAGVYPTWAGASWQNDTTGLEAGAPNNHGWQDEQGTNLLGVETPKELFPAEAVPADKVTAAVGEILYKTAIRVTDLRPATLGDPVDLDGLVQVGDIARISGHDAGAVPFNHDGDYYVESIVYDTESANKSVVFLRPVNPEDRGELNDGSAVSLGQVVFYSPYGQFADAVWLYLWPFIPSHYGGFRIRCGVRASSAELPIGATVDHLGSTEEVNVAVQVAIQNLKGPQVTALNDWFTSPYSSGAVIAGDSPTTPFTYASPGDSLLSLEDIGRRIDLQGVYGGMGRVAGTGGKVAVTKGHFEYTSQHDPTIHSGYPGRTDGSLTLSVPNVVVTRRLDHVEVVDAAGSFLVAHVGEMGKFIYENDLIVGADLVYLAPIVDFVDATTIKLALNEQMMLIAVGMVLDNPSGGGTTDLEIRNASSTYGKGILEHFIIGGFGGYGFVPRATSIVGSPMDDYVVGDTDDLLLSVFPVPASLESSGLVTLSGSNAMVVANTTLGTSGYEGTFPCPLHVEFIPNAGEGGGRYAVESTISIDRYAEEVVLQLCEIGVPGEFHGPSGTETGYLYFLFPQNYQHIVVDHVVSGQRLWASNYSRGMEMFSNEGTMAAYVAEPGFGGFGFLGRSFVPPGNLAPNDSFVQANYYVVSQSVNDPSTLLPSDGDTWIVGGAPVGDWAGHALEVAMYDSSLPAPFWAFTAPILSYKAWVADEGRFVTWTGVVWEYTSENDGQAYPPFYGVTWYPALGSAEFEHHGTLYAGGLWNFGSQFNSGRTLTARFYGDSADLSGAGGWFQSIPLGSFGAGVALGAWGSDSELGPGDTPVGALGYGVVSMFGISRGISSKWRIPAMFYDGTVLYANSNLIAEATEGTVEYLWSEDWEVPDVYDYYAQHHLLGGFDWRTPAEQGRGWLGRSPVFINTAVPQVTRQWEMLAAFNNILDKDLTSPPGGESVSDRYIVGSPAGGAWAGHEDEVAEVTGTGPTTWSFTSPSAEDTAWVEDEYLYYRWGGASWEEASPVHIGYNLLGFSPYGWWGSDEGWGGAPLHDISTNEVQVLTTDAGSTNSDGRLDLTPLGLGGLLLPPGYLGSYVVVPNDFAKSVFQHVPPVDQDQGGNPAGSEVSVCKIVELHLDTSSGNPNDWYTWLVVDPRPKNAASGILPIRLIGALWDDVSAVRGQYEQAVFAYGNVHPNQINDFHHRGGLFSHYLWISDENEDGLGQTANPNATPYPSLHGETDRAIMDYRASARVPSFRYTDIRFWYAGLAAAAAGYGSAAQWGDVILVGPDPYEFLISDAYARCVYGAGPDYEASIEKSAIQLLNPMGETGPVRIDDSHHWDFPGSNTRDALSFSPIVSRRSTSATTGEEKDWYPHGLDPTNPVDPSRSTRWGGLGENAFSMFSYQTTASAITVDNATNPYQITVTSGFGNIDQAYLGREVEIIRHTDNIQLRLFFGYISEVQAALTSFTAIGYDYNAVNVPVPGTDTIEVIIRGIKWQRVAGEFVYGTRFINAGAPWTEYAGSLFIPPNSVNIAGGSAATLLLSGSYKRWVHRWAGNEWIYVNGRLDSWSPDFVQNPTDEFPWTYSRGSAAFRLDNPNETNIQIQGMGMAVRGDVTTGAKIFSAAVIDPSDLAAYIENAALGETGDGGYAMHTLRLPHEWSAIGDADDEWAPLVRRIGFTLAINAEALNDWSDYYPWVALLRTEISETFNKDGGNGTQVMYSAIFETIGNIGAPPRYSIIRLDTGEEATSDRAVVSQYRYDSPASPEDNTLPVACPMRNEPKSGGRTYVYHMLAGVCYINATPNKTLLGHISFHGGWCEYFIPEILSGY